MDIYSLVKNKHSKPSFKDELFKKILIQCHRRIKHSNDHNEIYTFFNIPIYVIGYPPFNRLECSVYLMKELENNGFNIQTYSDNILYINWQHIYDKVNEDNKIDTNILEYYPKIKKIDKTDNIPKLTNMQKSNQLIFNNNKFSLLN
jgi:hypothetical protein